MTLVWSSVTYPASIDTYYHPTVRNVSAGTGYMIDFVDIVYDNAPNTLAESILAIETKLGETSGDATGFGSIAFTGSISTPGILTVWRSLLEFAYTDELNTTRYIQVHSNKTGLAGPTLPDEHTQYALLAGRVGGQTLIGGTASGDDLTLQSTSHATRRYVWALDDTQFLEGGHFMYEPSGASPDYQGTMKLCVMDEVLLPGTIVYATSGGRYKSTIASDLARLPCVALSVSFATVGGTSLLLFKGLYLLATHSWTPGALLYVDVVSGGMTHTPPSTIGYYVQPVGYALTSNTIYFNPMLYWHEVV